jgi:Cryptococcal mannosyltransferase 1
MAADILQRRSKSRLLRVGTLLFFIWAFLDVLLVRRRLVLRETAQRSGLKLQKHKIFIASTHWNNEVILRSHWNDAVVELVKHFGVENVYISVYESGSWDNSKGALRELDQKLSDLGAQKTIVLDPETHAEEIAKTPAATGWILTPRNKTELRRIPFLANLRNRSLQPLFDLERNGQTFDQILFLNDVVFKLEDVLMLQDTNDGHYAAACALDFAHAPKYYDTFALRDDEGEVPLMQTWPYFRARSSRHAMKKGLPVPVKSCWNGMVFMDASPFYQDVKPLRFRGIQDSLAISHLEGSECCLIHADNPLTSERGLWLNPNVRVGYNPEAYAAVHKDDSWLSASEIVYGLWKNRLKRWFTTSWFTQWVVQRRLASWLSKSRDNSEPGTYCLINEMQVLVWNGWAHL